MYRSCQVKAGHRYCLKCAHRNVYIKTYGKHMAYCLYMLMWFHSQLKWGTYQKIRWDAHPHNLPLGKHESLIKYYISIVLGSICRVCPYFFLSKSSNYCNTYSYCSGAMFDPNATPIMSPRCALKQLPAPAWL